MIVFFSSRRRHTRYWRDWSSDVCSSDLTRFTDGWTLRTHYRMDGSWHIYRHGSRWRGGPAFSIRAILATDQWDCVGYRLHDVAMVRTAHEDQVVGHLGPDVLGPDWDLDEALRRLRAHPEDRKSVVEGKSV